MAKDKQVILKLLERTLERKMKKERFYMTVLHIIVCFRSRERERESHLRERDEDGAFTGINLGQK